MSTQKIMPVPCPACGTRYVGMPVVAYTTVWCRNCAAEYNPATGRDQNAKH